MNFTECMWQTPQGWPASGQSRLPPWAESYSTVSARRTFSLLVQEQFHFRTLAGGLLTFVSGRWPDRSVGAHAQLLAGSMSPMAVWERRDLRWRSLMHSWSMVGRPMKSGAIMTC